MQDWLHAGLKTPVRLFGLHSEGLNGALGVVTGWDEQRARCVVKLSGRTLLIKPENLDMVSDSEEESNED